MKKSTIQLLLNLLLNVSAAINKSPLNLPEEATLNFTGFANKYGQKSEELEVITDDGYILKIFHIPGNKSAPVLVCHGLFGSADNMIIRGKTSLAITLAENGYDVWAINARGTKYSRNHIKLDPDVDDKFWDFSFHEYGYYDLPATIDFILDKTGEKSLSAIGHSEGTTIFFVLGSTRPEYNDKIKVFIALAPVCFLSNTRRHLSAVIQLSPLINMILKGLGLEELFGENSARRRAMETVCTQPEIGYLLCLQLVFGIVGYDPDEMEPEFVPTFYGHFPVGSSRKTLYHFAQVGFRKEFAQFDYGPVKNLAVYKWPSPPNYDLSEVRMRVVLIAANNDGFVSLKDVATLRERLPNVVEYHVMDPPRFNHIDFITGRSTYKVLYPRILEILDRYLDQSKKGKIW